MFQSIYREFLVVQMAPKMLNIATKTVLVTILCVLPIVFSSDQAVIPAQKSQVNSWFQQNVGPFSSRKSQLTPELAAAEAYVKVIKVNAGGRGDFKTITDAIKSVPFGNRQRVIISIAPGKYAERVRIERNKPFITLYGDPRNMPTVTFNGDAAKYGTVDSATLIVESDYFVGVNLNIVNSSPRPDGKRPGAQAAALRISSDMVAFYNCKFFGFQDTVIDYKGKHFFKDCYIEGTVDFICGNGRSLYVNTVLHVIPGDGMAMITAQGRQSSSELSGYSFVHCTVTGTGKVAYLGRAWFPYARVTFSYTEISDAIIPIGWFETQKEKVAYFGEYKNTGPGANVAKRAPYVREALTDAEVRPYISLAHIEGSKWLLPPPRV